MPRIPAFGRLRQEDHKLEANPGKTVKKADSNKQQSEHPEDMLDEDD